jgi:adenine-specific DNA-methyltransferase
VLDFFAGSGTTGQAVMELNEEDGGSREFILVQLPEPTGIGGGRDNKISAITRERARRVGIAIAERRATRLLPSATPPQQQGIDLGFRVFALAGSNFKMWNSEPPIRNTESLVSQLELHIDHVVENRSNEDVLFELLIKSGFPLTTRVSIHSLSGKDVFSISEGMMLVCMDKSVTMETIKAIADQKPERVIVLDEAFQGNDQLKTNALQIMKSKGVTSFRTV